MLQAFESSVSNTNIIDFPDVLTLSMLESGENNVVLEEAKNIEEATVKPIKPKQDSRSIFSPARVSKLASLRLPSPPKNMPGLPDQEKLQGHSEGINANQVAILAS